jgi:hypothetical protein
MTRKVYRTAQGKTVDLGALQLKNESVRAVGNMSVNARGDLVDADGRPIDTRNQQVSRQYKKQTNTNVNNDQVYSSKNSHSAVSADAVDIPVPPEEFDDNFVKPQEPAAASDGLAGAIARARSAK